jgi:hypothetical protein
MCSQLAAGSHSARVMPFSSAAGTASSLNAFRRYTLKYKDAQATTATRRSPLGRLARMYRFKISGFIAIGAAPS